MIDFELFPRQFKNLKVHEESYKQDKSLISMHHLIVCCINYTQYI
jgi:hypothetical protein